MDCLNSINYGEELAQQCAGLCLSAGSTRFDLKGVANERLNVLQDLKTWEQDLRLLQGTWKLEAPEICGIGAVRANSKCGAGLYTQMVDRAVKKLRQSESGLSVEDIQVN
ncbi:MAG: hypothetical protein Ct9H300mP28_35900 [Pseudomonadota bacterium]|nr:MAG: hypothetical protein Ct9H300mP28_35900 [Pseudomonadota bacterium]